MTALPDPQPLPQSPARAVANYVRDLNHLKNIFFALAAGYAVGLFAWELAHRSVLENYILTNQFTSGERPPFVALALSAFAVLGLWLLAGYLRGKQHPDVTVWLDRSSGILLGLALLPFLPILMLQGLSERRPWLTMGLIALMAVLAGVASATARWPADGVLLERRTFSGRGPEAGLLVIGVLAALYAIFMSWLTLNRHNAFMTHSFDLGIHNQALYTLLHDGYMRSTQYGAEAINYIGDHFSPIFFLMAPFYALRQDAKMLLALQSFVLAAGAIPVYLLARRITASASLALALGSVYLLYPALHGANTFDFHQIVLATPLLLFSLYFLESGRDRAFVATLLLAMLVKEELGLTVAAIGVYVFIGRGRPRLGTALVITGLAYFILVTQVVMPALGGTPQLNRFAAVMAPGEEGLSAIARTLFTNPFYTLTLIFSSPERMIYLAQIMLPLLFLPLLGGSAWIAAIPAIAVSLLTNAETQFSIAYHYPAIFIPFAFYLAARGANFVLSLRRASHGEEPLIAAGPLASALIVAGLAMNYSYGWFLSQNLAAMSLRMQHATAVRECLSVIPRNASVSAMSDLVPHLSSRRDIYLFPIVNGAEYLAFDADPGANFWPFIEQDGRLDAIRELAPYVLSGEYGLVREQDGCLILQRGADPSSNGAAIRALLTSKHEAEDLRSDFPGSVVADSLAGEGRARRVAPASPHPDGKDALTYGPYEALFPGRYRAEFILRQEGAGGSGPIATVDIFSNAAGGALAGEDVFPGDAVASEGYVAFPVDVELQQSWPDLEYRILYHGSAGLSADQVRLSPIAANLSAGMFEAEDAPGDSSFGVIADEGASAGKARLAGPNVQPGALAEISVGDLLPGSYRADFTLKATPGGVSGPVTTLEVLSGGSVIASRALSAGDFASPGAYQTFPVEIGSDQPLTGITLRIRHEGGHELWADGVELIYLYREPG